MRPLLIKNQRKKMMKKVSKDLFSGSVLFSLLAIAIIVLVSSCSKPSPQNTEKIVEASIDTTWKQLTLREKIGQTMLMLYDPQEVTIKAEGSYEKYFEKYPVSGFFMSHWGISTITQADSIAFYMKKVVNQYSENTKIPLFIQQDFEQGVGNVIPGLTKLPSLMTVGAANDELLAHNFGKSIALEARSLGVNWLLHPVADLNLNQLNGLTSTRSLTDDPELAIKLLSQIIKGAQGSGVASTIKHFPGDGVDYRDQHLLTTENTLSMKKWEKTYGKVFQALIDGGASAVMTGHIRLPAYQTDSINGFLPPATLSRQLTTDLLKKKMGFKGVVVSDALNMSGFHQYYPTRISAQIASFKAGSDVLLWPDHAFMDTLEAKILNHEIPMSRLDDAVSRVWALKKKLNLMNNNSKVFRELSSSDKKFAGNTAKDIAKKAVTLVANKRNSLPLNPAKDKKILFKVITSPTDVSFQMKNFQTTFDALNDLGFTVDTTLNAYDKYPAGFYDQYDKMVFAFIRNPRPGRITLMEATEGKFIWNINSLDPEKVVIISYGDPYLHDRYFERIGTSVNAYFYNTATQLQVVKAITGQIPFQGKSPVKLTRLKFDLE
ncbi:MAG: glycoside hydrolase family 3 protein [Labilibaculum sp.]|nr:glycoside hydrolase family 3 N-terminal domain-containing protein [Labilibaculum sp.]MBI9057329.1 glycoside hydrolase family 3 protein [Labilibaculum sp.]